MKRFPTLLACLTIASALTPAAFSAGQTYVIDPVHSSVGFSIRHFVSKVPGTFTKFSGTIVFDRDNLGASQADATIEVGSVTTANDKRDTHLKSPDFFEADKFGTITFKSSSWTKTGEDTYDVAGDLTIKSVTKPVTLKVTSLGFGPGMQGAQLSGWEAAATIKRSDFGVNGPAMLGTMLGDDVAISISIEADLKP
jgi:polyisoprenoid-binding protein YceI